MIVQSKAKPQMKATSGKSNNKRRKDDKSALIFRQSPAMPISGLLNYQGEALKHVPYQIAQSEKKQLFTETYTEYEFEENAESPEQQQKPANVEMNDEEQLDEEQPSSVQTRAKMRQRNQKSGKNE